VCVVWRDSGDYVVVFVCKGFAVFCAGYLREFSMNEKHVSGKTYGNGVVFVLDD
jgi:hypothetical protein